MRHLHILLYAVILLSLPGGCLSTDESGIRSSFPKPFPDPQVPAMMTDGYETTLYLAQHIWNKYLDSAAVWSAFDDSTRIGGVLKEVFYQKYADYAGLLWSISPEEASGAQKSLMNRIERMALADSSAVHVFDAFCTIAEKVLYGANSDYRNEEYYIPVLETLTGTEVNSPLADSTLKKSYLTDLEGCRKNRPGEVAADFSFTTRDGRRGTLHGVKADCILLFFSNPGCNACLEIINSLKASERITRLISEKKIAVLNIYIDSDLTEWFKYMPVYPEEWTNAYQGDLQVREKGLYNVRAIPSLYILDESKKVILKDVAPSIALSYLEQMYND